MKLSIIIPTYNRLWSLPKAVESCFDKSLDLEVIVIDDGSTDNTWQWLLKQSNVIAINQQNWGKGWAIQKGLAAAKGKYIRFLDSDDWHLEGSSAALIANAEKSDLDVVCAGYQYYNDKEELLGQTDWTDCDDFIAQQLGECDSSHYSAYLFKKEFIADIPHRTEFGAFDDREFIIEVALKKPKTGFIEKPTFAHRVHGNERMQSVSGLKSATNNMALLNIYKKAFATLASNNQLTQRYKNAGCHNLWHLAHWVARHYLNDGRKIYDWVYELNPYFVPPEGFLSLMYKRMGFNATEKMLALRRRLIR